MNHITYSTEKRINELKKINVFTLGNQACLVLEIWHNIFAANGYCGASLKEFENYLGYKLDNKRQEVVSYYIGIHGIEIETNQNVKYIGTKDLSYVNIEDFNKFVKDVYEKEMKKCNF